MLRHWSRSVWRCERKLMLWLRNRKTKLSQWLEIWCLNWNMILPIKKIKKRLARSGRSLRSSPARPSKLPAPGSPYCHTMGSSEEIGGLLAGRFNHSVFTVVAKKLKNHLNMTTWLANLNGFQSTTAKTNTSKLGVNNIVNVTMHYFKFKHWFNELRLKVTAVFLHTIPHRCRTVW